jgi:hypothetical protein
VRAQIAQLLIEDERYEDADRQLASALLTDSTHVAWLALRAQGAFEAGDTIVGARYYRRALANAELDSTDALWKQVIGIASPEEIRAWEGVLPADRGPWLERFWARRNPNLFSGVNHRVTEHFQRWRVARREYPLVRPFAAFQRDAIGRAVSVEPSAGERAFHLRCEVYEVPPVTGMRVVSSGPGDIRNRPIGGLLAFMSDDEKAWIRRGLALGFDTAGLVRTALEREGLAALDPTVFAPLGFDLRNIDTTAARIGYNLATGLADRGLAYLRLGPPESMILGGDNSMDPQCNTTELVRWRYDQWGELRFAKPIAFSEGKQNVSEIMFRPMEPLQFEAMQTVLTTDATSEPAPLEFGIWMAELRHAHEPRWSELVEY